MEGSTKLRARRKPTLTQSGWCAALLFVASLPGCGGLVGSGPPQPPPANVTISVTPASAPVPLGESQPFAAAVEGAQNTAVTWSVNGIPGGNPSVGSIDANGVYTAPGILPAPASVSVSAASAVNSSKISIALVSLTGDISISLSPGSAAVELGATRAFAAAVNSDFRPNRGVAWSVTGIGCAGIACGMVDASGNYTAPQILPTPPAVSLTAASVADPSKSATAPITITSSFSLSVTGPPSVTAGTSAAFSATLTLPINSNPSRVISWSVSGAGCSGGTCGTISPDGIFTAPALPPSPATVQILATPLADPGKAGSISVSIASRVNVSVSPSSATLALGAVQTFQANVTGADDPSVTWYVNGIVGGNSVAGTIQNSQSDPDHTTYASPQTMPAGAAVIVRARSNADPTVIASATISFTAAAYVTLSPASATVALGERQSFTAAVNNTSNQAVAWLVNSIPGGNSAAGQICAAGSNPCQPQANSNGGSVDYVAPLGVPSPNPVTITAISRVSNSPSASAEVTILPHIVVSVQPGNVSIAGTGQQRFTAIVTGTENQQVIWTVAGAACSDPTACGAVDSTGLYTAPPSPPSPDAINVVATSLEDTGQSGSAALTITSGPAIFSLSPTSAYAGSAGGFTLLISGNNFLPSEPGPGSTILVAGSAHASSCALPTQCVTSLSAADLQSAANLSVQLQNPDGSLSNSEMFVVLAPGSGVGTIALTPSAPASPGNDIVVVDLSTNGGSGAPGNVSLNIAAIGAYVVATSSCALGGSPVVVQRPASGIASADLCVFSVSALDPFFLYTISGPPTPDITVTAREPLGLGILHLTLQVPATAAPGPRTLFVENPAGDMATGSGAIEVQ